MYGDIILHMVDHLHNNPVAFSYDDLRPWELPVHRHHAPRVTQSCHVLQLNLQNQIAEEQLKHWIMMFY